MIGGLDEIAAFRNKVSFLEVCSFPDSEYFGSTFWNLPFVCFCDYSIGAKECGRGWVCAHQLGLGLLDSIQRDNVIACYPTNLNPRNIIRPKGKVSKSTIIEKNQSLTGVKSKGNSSLTMYSDMVTDAGVSSSSSVVVVDTLGPSSESAEDVPAVKKAKI